MNTVEKLDDLRRAGVNIGEPCCSLVVVSCAQGRSVRMNFSHGSYEYHQSVIDNTRKMLAGQQASQQTLENH